MLEPHPPHETPHTWKDFFIHIAVIVVGLLIAVGLEQTVEAIHRHHARKHLVQNLQDDTDKIIRESARAEQFLTEMLVWVRGREQVLSTAAHDQALPGPMQPFPRGSLDLPDEPVYRAAKTGSQLELLSEADAAAYAELDATFESLHTAYLQWQEATQHSQVVRKFTQYGAAPGDAPFAHATPEDLREEYKAYLAQERGMLELRLWCRQVHDAATAVSSGERDVSKIQQIEHQRQDLP